MTNSAGIKEKNELKLLDETDSMNEFIYDFWPNGCRSVVAYAARPFSPDCSANEAKYFAFRKFRFPSHSLTAPSPQSNGQIRIYLLLPESTMPFPYPQFMRTLFSATGRIDQLRQTLVQHIVFPHHRVNGLLHCNQFAVVFVGLSVHNRFFFLRVS